MKLATFRTADARRVGAVLDGEIADLSAADPLLDRPLEDVLALGPEAIDRAAAAVRSARQRYPLADVQLAPPVRPRKFFAIGLNYADHVAESGLPTPEHLTVFAKAVTCVTGPYDPVERPIVSDQLDYEGELGVVIGHRCRHVPAERAAEVVAGFLVVNDVSVRDWQLMTTQWSLGKSFDTHGPIGPWLTTPDEVGDPHDLRIRTFVNGESRQDSHTSNLIFDCFRQIEILTHACTLEPGDVIATGTPSGVAAARDGQPWLVPGDHVRVEIERLGAIENVVVQEQPVGGVSAAA